MSELEKKISNVKEKMLTLDNASMEYQHYSDVLRELEKSNRPVVTLHKESEQICESCQ